ncbi:Rossmann fold nucleotide-binding protein Smf possibly involved in DNA uptake [hydrothermal vent metagenome]|uniref:Rossmann fold nucleotide-binding protein Smf possibly involved in DNA uptake n=1 Tax=hydrothermal vent metagenome TaxID=652676 RepID=A0A3B0U6N4_9ZZZZ
MYGSPKTANILSDNQRLSWLRLIRSLNVGPATFRQLINRFGSAQNALEALPELTLKGGGKSAPRIASIEEAEAEIGRIEQFGARLVAIGEPDYPVLLQYIHAAPPLLTIIGDHDNNDKKIAIVGARNASASGRKITMKIAAELGEAGFCIVSGLARGIDAAAHNAALKSGTIAVFAGGLDFIYPEENTALAHDIVDNGGLLISEMKMGHEPRARDFPRRNRLVSGLCRGIMVVEAANRSGSLITARLALEQNREVFAVPGSPMDPRAAGTNKLIQEGAKLVISAADIIEELAQGGSREPDLFALEQQNGFEPDQENIGAEPEVCDNERQRVINALSVTPTPIDELITASGLSAPAVLSILLELDLAGRIERASGQLVALCD